MFQEFWILEQPIPDIDGFSKTKYTRKSAQHGVGSLARQEATLCNARSLVYGVMRIARGIPDMLSEKSNNALMVPAAVAQERKKWSRMEALRTTCRQRVAVRLRSLRCFLHPWNFPEVSPLKYLCAWRWCSVVGSGWLLSWATSKGQANQNQ